MKKITNFPLIPMFMRSIFQSIYGKSMIDYLIAFSLDVLYPKKCISCDKSGDYLCINCAKKIEYIRTSTCPICGKITKNFSYCQNCRKRSDIRLDGLFIATNFDSDVIKGLIYKFKYDGITEISTIIADIIYYSIRDRISFDNTSLFSFVPLHKNKEKSRGFNQAELISSSLAKRFNNSALHLLEKSVNNRAQAKLKRSERFLNVVNVYSVVDPKIVLGKSIYLVDDIATTGATLNSCAIALKKAGAKKVYGVVLAKNL